MTSLRSTLLSMAAAALVAGCQTAQDVSTPESPPVSVQLAELGAPDLAQTWLLNNCGIDDLSVLVAELRDRAAELEPLFLDAVRAGPPDDLTRSVADAAQRRFSAGLRELAEGESFGLSDDDRAALKTRDPEAYVERVRANFDIAYRSQAVLGLGIVGSEETRAFLQEMAADDESRLQSSARRALR